jgi:hypothetical protein
VLELVPAVVLFGAWAQDLDDQCGIRDRISAARVALRRATNDRHVGIGGQAGSQHAHAQISVVRPTATTANLGEQEGYQPRRLAGSAREHGAAGDVQDHAADPARLVGG